MDTSGGRLVLQPLGWMALCLSLFVHGARAGAAEPPPAADLFQAKQGGYELYRIPGLVCTAKGTLLAYCEARKLSRSDWGEIDLLYRRSADGGVTWSDPARFGNLPADATRNEVAVKQKLGVDGKFTMNNPVAIAARDGTIHALYCVEYARCFYRHSADDGATFSEPVEITAAFDKFRPEYAWRVLATGPGHGIELKSGRLLVPVWLSTGEGGHAHRPSCVATIYSDDRGRTWQRGEIVVAHGETIINPSESAVAELSDGRVLINIRSESHAQRRLTATSADGARRWSKPTLDDALVEPICMASLVSLGNKSLAFANPANLLAAGGKPGAPGKARERKNLTLRISRDDGQTWPVERVLEPGPSAYSDLAVGPDGTLYCFFERGSALSLLKIKPQDLR